MKARTSLIVLALVALVVVCVTPFVGMKALDLDLIFSGTSGSIDADIFWSIRLPRVLIAFLAGGALAMSGMAFQSMFNNPLAAPFTLGVSSGASLGAALYVYLGLSFSVLGVSGVSLSAFLGAVLAIGMVYGLTRARKRFSTPALLLAGVAVSFFFAGIILFVQYASNLTDSYRIIRWIMGGIDSVGYASILDMAPFVVSGCAILFLMIPELDLMLTGDDIATSRGINVARTKTIVFFATSLMVGGVVALVGPIGFIGMVAPHICRLGVGWNHRVLAPASFLFGGAFLVLCDTLARTAIAPAEIPVGVITSLLGGPFFLWLVLWKGPRQA